MDSTTVSDVTKKKSNMATVMGGGISLAALGAGFGDCAFDADKADSCVAHAQTFIDPFYQFGMGILEWIAAIITAAF